MNRPGVAWVGCEREALRKRLWSGVGGNRGLAGLGGGGGGGGGGDEDGIPLDLHSVGDDRERRRTAQDLARLEREDAFVPRTSDGAARGVDSPLRKAGARVATAVRDRVHGALH